MRNESWMQPAMETAAATGAGGGSGDGAPPPPPRPSGQDDATFYQEEAKKAFRVRDELKQKIRDLEQRVLPEESLSEYQALKQQAAKAEEERAKKAGEFDQLRAQLLKKHDEELAAERTKAQEADSRLRKTLIGLSFAQASDWFGANGKTILTPEIAEAFYGKYVDLDGDQVVVKDAAGQVILDVRTGKPARFADAIGELITSLPNKDHVLRGSGKTGSGSSGGSSTAREAIDTNQLRSSDFRDPKVREAVRRQQAEAGGLQIGPGFDRLKPVAR